MVDKKQLREGKIQKFINEMSVAIYPCFDGTDAKRSLANHYDHFNTMLAGSVDILNNKQTIVARAIGESKLKKLGENELEEAQSLSKKINEYSGAIAFGSRNIEDLPIGFSLAEVKNTIDKMKQLFDPKKLNNIEKNILEKMIEVTGKYTPKVKG